MQTGGFLFLIASATLLVSNSLCQATAFSAKRAEAGEKLYSAESFDLLLKVKPVLLRLVNH